MKRKTVTTLVTVIMVILFTGIIQAQEKSEKPLIEAKGGGICGYFIFGSNLIDIKSLNSRLENKGYPELSNDFISLGGGGHFIIGRVIIGGEGHGFIANETTKGSYKTSLSSSYGFFNLGYLTYSSAIVNIYPILGLGGGGIDLRIRERGTFSFDDVLDNPKKGAHLSAGGFLVNLALGLDYLLKLGEEDETGKGRLILGGLILGVRLGYIFAPIKRDWEMDGIDISGGPKIGITGPYIHFKIGAGEIFHYY